MWEKINTYFAVLLCYLLAELMDGKVRNMENEIWKAKLKLYPYFLPRSLSSDMVTGAKVDLSHPLFCIQTVLPTSGPVDQ